MIVDRLLSLKEKDLIKTELSVYIKSDYAPTKRYLSYEYNDGVYSLPFHWAQNNIPDKLQIDFKKVSISVPDSGIVLRPLQISCVEKCMEQFKKETGGGIINLSTGSGKTIISLYLISKVKYKTLIVVNKIELLNQWKEAIHKIFRNKVSVGIIQGGTFEKECDICIGMLQTISQNKKYKKTDFQNFTLVFIDEVHNTPSEVFNKALHKIRNKYTFGLSATINRKDGMEKIIHWHLGPVIFSDCLSSNKQQTEFKKVSYKGISSKEVKIYNGNLNISQMLNNLSSDNNRTKLIGDTILEALEEPKRRMLVLSDRIQLLKALNIYLGHEISGLFIGKTSSEEKNNSKSKKVLLATYSIASEGFNHPELNCLLFATPRSNINQSIGRIYRKIHDISPLIIDIVDSVGIFICQYNKRKKIYSTELSSVEPEPEETSECLFE